MTEECITPLRRRMIEDMSVRHFASKTQHNYILTVMKAEANESPSRTRS
jgi:hypothetical protein